MIDNLWYRLCSKTRFWLCCVTLYHDLLNGKVILQSQFFLHISIHPQAALHHLHRKLICLVDCRPWLMFDLCARLWCGNVRKSSLMGNHSNGALGLAHAEESHLKQHFRGFTNEHEDADTATILSVWDKHYPIGNRAASPRLQTRFRLLNPTPAALRPLRLVQVKSQTRAYVHSISG